MKYYMFYEDDTKVFETKANTLREAEEIGLGEHVLFEGRKYTVETYDLIVDGCFDHEITANVDDTEFILNWMGV